MLALSGDGSGATPGCSARCTRGTDAMRAALSLEGGTAKIAQWLRFSERLLVTARGDNFAEALDRGAQVQGDSTSPPCPDSAADRMHGPIAMVEPGYPAVVF